MNPRALLSALFLTLSANSFVVFCTITASNAVTFAPSLLEQLAVLEATLEAIETDQIVLAAIKMRSLVPDYDIETREDSSDEEDRKKKPSAKSAKSAKSDDSDDSGSDDDSDSDEVTVPTSRTLLIKSLNSLLKSLPSASKDEALIQIAGFDFAGQKSLDQFLAEKETEAALKLNESIAAIRQIQRVLNSRSRGETPANLTANLLARIVAKLDDLQDEYEELQELQKQAQSKKSSKKEKAKKLMPESLNKIAKIVQKLADILDDI